MSALFDLAFELPLGAFDLALSLRADERRVGLFGASGAGKTSALEAIAGWRRPRAGRIEVAGRTLFDAERGVDVPVPDRRVGYVPQDALLFPHRSVAENVAAGARATDASLRTRVLEVLELGALVDRRPDTLSGGERQRVALARALCSRPDVLLLDEPLAALDRPLRRRVLPYLWRVSEEFELPTVFVSHEATEVQLLCDRCVVLERGRVRAEGDPARVVAGAGASGDDYENVLLGRVVELARGTASLALDGGAELRVPAAGLRAGERVAIGLRAEDVLVSRTPVEGLSARNRVAARVLFVEARGEGRGDEVLLAAGIGGTDELRVALTAESTAELELEPGRDVWLLWKTTSCQVLGAIPV